MVISQGDVWWVDFGEPIGSQAGYERPAVIVQGDQFNLSRVGTVVCVPLTSNLRHAAMPGNIELEGDVTGLPKTSVANVSLVTAVDRGQLIEQVGRLPEAKLGLVLRGIDVVLGR